MNVTTQVENTPFPNTTTGSGNSENTAQPASQDPLIVVAENLWKYCSPLLMLIGTFGNVVTIIVLRRKSMWKLSSSPYLLVLGVADILVLYTGLLRQWLRFAVNLDVRQLSPIVCKLHLFSLYLSADFSVWILVALSVERFIHVCFPFTAKVLCTRRRAMVAMAAILVGLSLINCHILYGYGSVFDSDTSQLISHCSYLFDDYSAFADNIWPWIDLSVFSLVPFCIIVVCNISLIRKIVRSRRLKKATSSEGGNDQRGKPSSMTALLVSLNTLFLVSTGPISIYLIAYPDWVQSSKYEGNAHLTLWGAIVNQLMYLNNSVNFLFYCISGPRFRKELKVMCSRRNAVGATVVETQSVLPSGISAIPSQGQIPRPIPQYKETPGPVESAHLSVTPMHTDTPDGPQSTLISVRPAHPGTPDGERNGRVTGTTK